MCRIAALAVTAALAGAGTAAADGWLPHGSDATWTYEWSDTAYSPTPTKEKLTVKSQAGAAFTLAWTTDGLGNPAGAASGAGEVSFAQTPAGIVDTNWQSTLPQAAFPVLCATPVRCANSLASAYYNVIWGSYRTPVLAEPLLTGVTWTGAGGVRGDVSSSSDYEGVETVTVPAFPAGVQAAKVRTDLTQAGALGDPYGSGVRTTWWVYGVGPVKVVFDHTGGPVTTVVLDSTNQTPQAAPADTNYFPLAQSLTGTYRWTNGKHLRKPVVERFTIDQTASGSARYSVKSVSGPIRVAGAYVFTTRLDGVTLISAATKAASLAKLPPLGPASSPPPKRRHFFTPFDLMTFGFNPILPAYPARDVSWAAQTTGADYQVYGVSGVSKVLGVSRVTVPAGTFDALVVRTTLLQPGFPFGSGTRTSWFAPGRGLVKLVFAHRDGSISRVELLR